MGDNLFVSIIMPIRNEVEHINKSLNSVRNQNYPIDKIEILVCDGISIDGTREIVKRHMTEDNRIYLVDNYKKTAPSALNLGIGRAKGDVIIRIDGHCEIPSDYIKNCISLLENSQADCVGGIIETIGATNTARVIASAQSSLIGVGNARFRTGIGEGSYVDTLAFGAYRKAVFDKIGLFDEELIRNQDDEFNARLIQSGGRIWLDPMIQSIYYSRGSIRRLWKQYYQYGYYKVRVIQKRKGLTSLRSIIHSMMILGFTSCFITGIGFGLWFPLIRLGCAYSFSIIIASIINRNVNLISKPLLILALITLHFSYGVGGLMGLFAFRNDWSS